jgi:putative acetyltransferase
MHRIHKEARMLGIVELSSDVSVTAESFFLHQGFHVIELRFPVRYGV